MGKINIQEVESLRNNLRINLGFVNREYKNKTSSINSKMSSVISSYAEYGDVTSKAREIQRIISDIKREASSLEKMTSKLTDGLKGVIGSVKSGERESSVIVKTNKAKITPTKVRDKNVAVRSTNLSNVASKGSMVFADGISSDEASYLAKILEETTCLRTADVLLAQKQTEDGELATDEKKDLLVDIFNDIAISGDIDYSFEVFGNRVTVYSEVYSDYSTVTIGTGIDGNGNFTSKGVNIYPSTEGNLKGQMDIRTDGKTSEKIGISGNDGISMWTTGEGNITFISRKSVGDNLARTFKTYSNISENTVGVDLSLDTRGKEYDGGLWTKIGIKVDFVKPDLKVQVQEQETEEGIESTLTGITNVFVNAKDWTVGKAEEIGDYAELVGEGIAITAGNIAEGIANTVSDTVDFVAEHPVEVIAGGVIVVGAGVCILAAPATGGGSLAGLKGLAALVLI